MAAEIITKEDLDQFKRELLQDLERLVKGPEQPSSWLRSADVRKMLNISHGTLRELRIQGELKYSKVLGTCYYKLADVEKMMESNRHQ